ncbi:MAG: cell division protein FtsH, partial [Actinobacteria bacterium]|nr:cell division protein FtsH [Actinomycetota bacterium]
MGPPAPPRDGRRRGGSTWVIVAVVVVAILVNVWIARTVRSDGATAVDYTTLVAQARSGNIESVRIDGRTIEADLRREAVLPDGTARPARTIEATRPEFVDDDLLDVLVRDGVPVTDAGDDDGGGGWLVTVLVAFGPAALIVLGTLWLLRRAGGGAAGFSGFGRSRAIRYERPGQRVTFADVAGVDEAKDELREIVDVLRDPERYRSVGARAPRGVLLLGPP